MLLLSRFLYIYVLAHSVYLCQFKNVIRTLTEVCFSQTFIGPKTTPEGYKILFSHAVSSDTKQYDMMTQMKYLIMTLEASLVNEDLGPGHIVIFDISTLSTGHILKFKPCGIKKTSNYLQVSYICVRLNKCG